MQSTEIDIITIEAYGLLTGLTPLPLHDVVVRYENLVTSLTSVLSLYSWAKILTLECKSVVIEPFVNFIIA